MAQRLVINGERARKLRRKADLTQEQVAVQIGIAGSSVRRIEGGNASIRLTTLGKLARLYKVKPADLLRWK